MKTARLVCNLLGVDDACVVRCVRWGERVFVFGLRWDSFSILMRDCCHFYRASRRRGARETLSRGLYKRLPPRPRPSQPQSHYKPTSTHLSLVTAQHLSSHLHARLLLSQPRFKRTNPILKLSRFPCVLWNITDSKCSHFIYLHPFSEMRRLHAKITFAVVSTT